MTGFPLVVAHLPKNRRERVRVALDQYQGNNLVDVRVTFELSESSGVQSPSKKGVSLNVRELPALIEALQVALAEAMRLDWFGGEHD